MTTAARGERQALIERMPELLRPRDALVKRMPEVTAPEQAAAGPRVQSLANEIAETYARIRGQDRPPPAATASWA